MVRAAAPAGWTAWAINYRRTGPNVYHVTRRGKPPPYEVEDCNTQPSINILPAENLNHLP